MQKSMALKYGHDQMRSDLQKLWKENQRDAQALFDWVSNLQPRSKVAHIYVCIHFLLLYIYIYIYVYFLLLYIYIYIYK